MNGQQSHLNEKQVEEAVRLLKDASSVELKLTVPDSDRYSVLQDLDLDILDAELRDVVFFDTPDLKLNKKGIVVRARRMRKGGDAVIKLRPVTPDELPEKLRRSKSFSIELDAMPGTFVCSGTLKAPVDNDEVKEALEEKRAIRKLFSPEQRDLFKELAPKGLDLDSLAPFGPIHVAKLKYEARRLKDRMATAEMWFYPDSSRTLELSLKCAPTEAFQVMAEARAVLASRGLTPTGEQQSKTQKALQYFSRLYNEKKAA